MTSANSEQPSNRPNWLQRAAKQARESWNGWDRPSWDEVTLIYLPVGLAIGGLAVAVADEVFDLHMAQAMANVRVDPNENIIERTVDEIIHEIGAKAVEEERKHEG